MRAALETVILAKVRCRRQQLYWQQNVVIQAFAGMTTFCIGKAGSSARWNSKIMKPLGART